MGSHGEMFQEFSKKFLRKFWGKVIKCGTTMALYKALERAIGAPEGSIGARRLEGRGANSHFSDKLPPFSPDQDN